LLEDIIWAMGAVCRWAVFNTASPEHQVSSPTLWRL